MSEYALKAAFLSLVLVNLIVSIYLLKRDDLEHFQKAAQIVIVWLIPFLGALLVWLFNRSNDEICEKQREFGGGANDSGNISSAAND